MSHHYPFEVQGELHINDGNEDGFYQQYCRMHLANLVLLDKVKRLKEDRAHLLMRLSKYEDEELCHSYDKSVQKNKRFRRNAHQIERYYKCQVKGCEKSYGSEGSLNQHYKLKHPEIYVTLPNVQPLREESEPEEKAGLVKSSKKRK